MSASAGAEVSHFPMRVGEFLIVVKEILAAQGGDEEEPEHAAEDGRLEPAAEELGRAAALMPERARVHYNHGLALLRAGKSAEAGIALREAYELAKSDPQIVHALTLFYTQSGDWQRALPLARELVALAPEDPGAREMQTRIEAELSAR